MTVIRPQNIRLLPAALAAALAAGTLDILAAFAINHAVPPLRVLQAVASGLMGTAAFAGGWAAGAIGLAAHFTLSLGFAALFVLAAARTPGLLRRPWISGPVYGLCVHAVMNGLVLPLSAADFGTPPPLNAVLTLAANAFAFGLPVAVTARAVLGEPRV